LAPYVGIPPELRSPPLCSNRAPPRGVDGEATPPATAGSGSCAQRTRLTTLKLTAQLTPRNSARTRRNSSGGRLKMNSNTRRVCAQMHGDAHRSSIHLAGVQLELQRSFIARRSHPRRAHCPRTPPCARQLRRAAYDALRRAAPRTEDAAPNAACSTASTATAFRWINSTSSLLIAHTHHVLAHRHARLDHAMSSRTHTLGSCWRTQLTHASRSGSCIALRARRTHTQRTHAEQHMTPARTAHALGVRTHTSSPPVDARTRTASSPPPPAATDSRWVYC